MKELGLKSRTVKKIQSDDELEAQPAGV